MNPINNVCAVVVTYNRLEMLQDAIAALRRQHYPCDILIINNGSTDGTKEYLDKESGINVIHQENTGGAGGFHTGMKIACEHGYEFVWVMDDDVIMSDDALEVLINDYIRLANCENIGFLCSKIISEHKDNVNIPIIDFSPNSSGYPDWGKYLENGIIRVKGTSFVSVLIPTKKIYDLGLPYKEYFIWGDDTEYTLRLSSKYRGFLSSKSLVVHRRIGNVTISIDSMNDKNRIRMFRKYVRNTIHYNAKIYSRKKAFNRIIEYSIKTINLLLKGDFYKAKIVFLGIIDYFTFNPTIKYPKKVENL